MSFKEYLLSCFIDIDNFRSYNGAIKIQFNQDYTIFNARVAISEFALTFQDFLADRFVTLTEYQEYEHSVQASFNHSYEIYLSSLTQTSESISS